jgi:hypothetical protein
VGVLFERRAGIDESQLPRHPEMDDEKDIVLEADEDVLPAPAHIRYPPTRDVVDEDLGFRVTDDRWKQQLAAHDGAPTEMRPQIRDDGFDLR